MGDLIQHGLSCPDCGSSDARAEYSENYFCFSCEKSTSKGKKGISFPAKRLNYGGAPPRYRRLYADKVGMEMCKRAGITETLMDKYGIHFTKNLQLWSRRLNKYVSMGARMIIPHPGGFEAKTLTGDKIKYVTYGSKDKLFKAGMSDDVVSEVCIVEDIFSAIRVGETMPCVSLLGTNFTKGKELCLRDLADSFIIWLDSDKAGRKAANKIKNRLEWTGAEVRVIHTDKDPKMYKDVEIGKILSE